MKYSVALISLAATLAVAQDLSKLPGCAITCGTQHLSSTKCSLTDTACLCNDTAYQKKVQDCVMGPGGCKGDDTCKAAQWAADSCKKPVPAGICPDNKPKPPPGGSKPPPPPPGGSKPPPPPPSHGGEPTKPCGYGDKCDGHGEEPTKPGYGGGHDGGDSGEEPTKPGYGGDHDGGDSDEEPTKPGYGGDSDEEPTTPPAYGAPAESSAAAEPTSACGESGEAATPVPDSYDTPTDTAAAPCACATGGAGTVPYGQTPAESSEAGIPVTTVELPCATESAPAQEPVPAAETPCPTLSTRPYPPPVNTGSPVPVPAESEAAGVPTYGAGENTNTTAGVPEFASSGNKMVTLSSLGAGIIAMAMLVAF